MNAMEIIEQIKGESPDLLGKLPDKKAARIVSAALAQVARSIAATDAGVVRVPGLGVFRVRQQERLKEGETEKVKVRRVIYSMPKQGGRKEAQPDAIALDSPSAGEVQDDVNKSTRKSAKK